MKKLMLILAVVFFTCSNDDDCNCKYSEYLDMYVPKSWSNNDIQEASDLSNEQKAAINNNCKRDCD